MKIINTALALLIIPSLAFAQPYSVHDGDTVRDIKTGERIRLARIDAPELKQTCDGGYDGGVKARNWLAAYADTMVCKTNGKDRYKRSLGECYWGDINLNELQVLEGYAFSYKGQTQEQEDMARKRGIGVHKYRCQQPGDYRKQHKIGMRR